MRVVTPSILLAAMITAAAPAQAQPAAQAPRATVVDILGNAEQALLRDRDRDDYVVVRVGDTFQAFRVSVIEIDQVVLTSLTVPNQHYVLPRARPGDRAPARPALESAPPAGERPALHQPGGSQGPAVNVPQAQQPHAHQPVVSRDGAHQLHAVEQPIVQQHDAHGHQPHPVQQPFVQQHDAQQLPGHQPHAAQQPHAHQPIVRQHDAPQAGAGQHETHQPRADAPAPQLIDPYPEAADEHIPVVLAPPASRASEEPPAAAAPAPVHSAPVHSAPVHSAPVHSAPVHSAPAEPPPPQPAPAPANRGPTTIVQADIAQDERFALSRADFDAALADFHSLSQEVQLALISEGIRIDGLARGSLLHRLGMRTGDVILTVDGQKIASIEDAASVYARLRTVSAFQVQVRRGAAPLTLHYQLTR